MHYLVPGLFVLAAYLIGSINGSLLIGRLKKIDIRSAGSGNAGGTNALRTQGFMFALGVIIIDIGKAVLVLTLLPWLMQEFKLWQYIQSEIAVFLAAAAVIVGHCYPVWHGFKGGKGAATLIGVLLVIAPVIVLYLLLLFFTLLILSGYVGPNTVLVALAAPVIFAMRHSAFSQSHTFWFLVVTGLFITFTHRENLKRFFNGTENQFDKVRLLHRLFNKDES
ncbi:MAG: glycerol-3-phosphate 1-O-acyltransferase PlsY [Gammaproteobacteria bacterium]|nr:glycerol-3-phosphate 1-O-acyltransferase PlsY [Gammaproteobacteria bacterium]NNM12759.1 glycerol-3-phosphate 1-O-acyltransferase PlsY [Gammaproteobacteria bacterium]